jgi:hypothetical protein
MLQQGIACHPPVHQVFTIQQQTEAVAELLKVGIDLAAELEGFPPAGRKIKVVYTAPEPRKEQAKIKRVYQCAHGIGYKHVLNPDLPRSKYARPATFSSEKCLMHVGVIFLGRKPWGQLKPGETRPKATVKDCYVSQIIAYDHHNCVESGHLQSDICFPLHESVYDRHLQQMLDGMDMKAIRKSNKILALDRSPLYRGIERSDQENESHRYVMLDHDNKSLYRKYLAAMDLGLDSRVDASVVLMRWWDKNSPGHRPDITSNMAWFTPYSDTSERFEAIVVTPAMTSAAWKYGYSNQMIMDGTFGLTKERILCFILMVVDDQRKGIPVGFLLFSALEEHKGTAGSYTAQVLKDLLVKWRDWVSRNRPQIFQPRLCIPTTTTRSGLL